MEHSSSDTQHTEHHFRQACVELDRLLRAGEPCRVEELFAAYPELIENTEYALELVYREFDTRRELGQRLAPVDWYARFPQWRDRLRRLFEVDEMFDSVNRADRPFVDTALPSPEMTETESEFKTGRSKNLELLGEVGRGGMGVIFRARDLSLGRDLAVKVLRPEHRNDMEVRRRFVEEAQIGGQLQHPGVVPVHEFGSLPDGRPFFTMKLIQGQTLAELLQQRADPADCRPRFLKIFEQVCETVAYAHSRAVIHRDLKPANIMVGAFGEVQVMDWGLAKVIARDNDTVQDNKSSDTIRTVRVNGDGASQAGAVMGTLAYMSPEQARGEVNRLDERCDVFGLAAILCEILTGMPPFTTRASEIDQLANAHTRLACSNADAELIRLARRCLAFEREDRPRNAGEMTATLRDYLQSVDARLRQAELARAEAQAKAMEERKRRRLTAWLAASVLALVVVAGGSAWWIDQKRVARQQELARQESDTAEAVEGLLREAARFQGQEQLSEAHAALRQAEGRLDAGPANERLRREVSDFRNDLSLAAELEEIRLEQAEVDVESNRFDQGRAVPRYREAFQRYLLDPTAGDVNYAAARIAERVIWPTLRTALVDWAELTKSDEERQRLRQVVASADPDFASPSTKQRALAAVLEKDAAAVRVLAASIDVNELPPVIIELMARRLRYANWNADALQLLRRAQEKYPGDFWITQQLAICLTHAEPPQWEMGARFYTAASALRPQNPGVLNNLGLALDALKRREEAIAVYRQAIRIRPDYAHAYSNLGNALTRQHRLEEAVAAHEMVIRIQPGLAVAYYNLGWTLSAQGRFVEATNAYFNAIQRKDGYAEAYQQLGMVMRAQHRFPEAIAAFRAAIISEPSDADAYGSLGFTLLSQNRKAEADAVYVQGIEFSKNPIRVNRAFGKSLAEHGYFDEAIASYQQALKLLPRSDPNWEGVQNDIRACRRLIEIDGRLMAVLRGEARASEVDLVHFAEVCFRCRKLYAGAARFYRDAFSVQPGLAESLKNPHRPRAARAAALAGASQGEDDVNLDEPARSDWRRQALSWLQADLAFCATRLSDGSHETRATIQRRLREWHYDPAFAEIRDSELLAKLAPTERLSCQQLWADVDACLVRCSSPESVSSPNPN